MLGDIKPKKNMIEDMNNVRGGIAFGQDLGIPVEEDTFLSERIKDQSQIFIDWLEQYNSTLPAERQRPPEDYRFLRNFFPAFIMDRNERANEVNSPDYKEVIGLVEEALPMTTLSVMCMDGRVKPVHVFGFSAGIGSSIRKPGGLLKEFIRSKDGDLNLEEGTNFADLLDEALIKNNSIAEVFDSHYGCAARKGEESARGGTPSDAGLYSDVLHKREMVKATREYILANHGEDKHVALIQTTFNPITGYLYMGLETDKSLAYARKYAQEKAVSEGMNPNTASPEYSKEVLRGLVSEGLIISTGKLIENQAIRDAFDQRMFDVSWKDEYINTARKFWTGISEMKESLLPVFEKSITSVYPQLGLSDKKTRRELEERAMLLMCNAFNAYLHNSDHSELEYLEMDDSIYEEQEHYEYDEHIEEGIKVSEGGYPPYDIPMFVINSGDPVNMASYIELASGIVRENRRKGKIIDRSGAYTSPQDFAKAPVPVIMQEIIRDQRLTEDDWITLEQIDWKDLKNIEWDKMSSEQFAKYLEKKGKLSNSLSNGIDRLRKKMAIIFDRDALTSAHLIEQYKVALPVVCDQDRKTHAIIPFVKLGY